MSLGRLTAALASGNQEFQLALASLNLDVSLIKMEAPTEYRPLALALSPRRKAEAEDGATHATARKLQALFSGLYVPTPKLYSVYGTRASEITEKQRGDSKGARSNGPFAEHIGVEGGSIWAAATSGTSSAIAIHLLACMLARVFTANEATAAWEEIVTIRKRQVLESADSAGLEQMFSVLAAKSAPTRQHLADWDASARSWLRIADQAMERKQRQLLLIINNNKSVPVSLHESTFESIVQAWSKAMIAVEKLIQGMPHSIVDGSVLLALSAWHIYPDMSVLGERSHFVKQGDDLVAQGGLLTLGLESAVERNAASEFDGVTWSLPLAFYHYYGTPIAAERSLATDGTRFSVLQFLLVAAGAVFIGWSQPSLDARQMARLVQGVCRNMIRYSSNRRNELRQGLGLSEESWPSRLAHAASHLLDSEGTSYEEGCRLIAYGRRRCTSFLGVKEGERSLFSQLQQVHVIMPMLRTADTRIQLLRRMALRLRIKPVRLLIRYATHELKDNKAIRRYGYATVQRTARSEESGDFILRRWQARDAADVPAHLEPGELQSDVVEADVLTGPNQDGTRFFWCNAPSPLRSDGLSSVGIDKFFGRYAELAMYRGNANPAKPRVMDGVPYHLIIGDPSTAAIYEAYDKASAVSMNFHVEELVPVFEQSDIKAPSLMSHISGVARNTNTCKDYASSQQITSLKAVATVAKIYEQLNGASIATLIVKTPLASAHWLPVRESDESNEPGLKEAARQASSATVLTESQAKHMEVSFEPYDLDRASTFACIASMESGTVNISPTGLKSVMALSSCDSLFVATPLVNDPALSSATLVTRIQGNIGRAGISMMVPPTQKLHVLEPTDEWNLVNHAGFDGNFRDSFQGTSLHLSFTEFSLTIDTGKRGLRTSEVVLLETVISVHDKGRHIADLDVLAATNDTLLRIVPNARQCGHSRRKHSISPTEASEMTLVIQSEEPVDQQHTGRGATQGAVVEPQEDPKLDVDPAWVLDDIADDSADDSLISVDSWHEFLDRPQGAAVFRAHGNWQARLAAAALSVSRGQLTLVFGAHVCWKCAHAERERFRHKRNATFLI